MVPVRMRPDGTFNLQVSINEAAPGRQRRRGQLSLVGSGWVYLRGDREHPSDSVLVEVQ